MNLRQPAAAIFCFLNGRLLYCPAAAGVAQSVEQLIRNQ
jgi:hypothetical protein